MRRRHLLNSVQTRVGNRKQVNTGLVAVITAQYYGVLAAVVGAAAIKISLIGEVWMVDVKDFAGVSGHAILAGQLSHSGRRLV